MFERLSYYVNSFVSLDLTIKRAFDYFDLAIPYPLPNITKKRSTKYLYYIAPTQYNAIIKRLYTLLYQYSEVPEVPLVPEKEKITISYLQYFFYSKKLDTLLLQTEYLVTYLENYLQENRTCYSRSITDNDIMPYRLQRHCDYGVVGSSTYDNNTSSSYYSPDTHSFSFSPLMFSVLLLIGILILQTISDSSMTKSNIEEALQSDSKIITVDFYSGNKELREEFILQMDQKGYDLIHISIARTGRYTEKYIIIFEKKEDRFNSDVSESLPNSNDIPLTDRNKSFF